MTYLSLARPDQRDGILVGYSGSRHTPVPDPKVPILGGLGYSGLKFLSPP